MAFGRTRPEMPTAESALPGRREPAFEISGVHAVNGNPIVAPFPDGLEVAVFGMGCFWGAERLFWTRPGVWATAVGYAGGFTPNPTYEETCSGRTGHAEVVQLTFDPAVISYSQVLELFFRAHDPTTLNRQGADTGTQYRSTIMCHDAQQLEEAHKAKAAAQANWDAPIVTEIVPAPHFYAAEEDHQDYFSNNPNAPYCFAVIRPKLAKLEKAGH